MWHLEKKLKNYFNLLLSQLWSSFNFYYSYETIQEADCGLKCQQMFSINMNQLKQKARINTFLSSAHREKETFQIDATIL